MPMDALVAFIIRSSNMKELYKIKVNKSGVIYYDMYLAWFHKRVHYERVSPTFKGLSYRILISSAIEVKSVEEMKNLVLSNVN